MGSELKLGITNCHYNKIRMSCLEVKDVTNPQKELVNKTEDLDKTIKYWKLWNVTNGLLSDMIYR